MAELKRTFTGGKMDKDTDERIVPNGVYREALNISVATSEDSDVGAAQNILGNIKVGEAIQHTTSGSNDYGYGGYNFHVASIVDPQTDMLYRFVHTAASNIGIWMDRIVEFDTSKKLSDSWEEKEHAVFIDIFKVRCIVDRFNLRCEDSSGASDSGSIILHIQSNCNQLRWGMAMGVLGQEDHRLPVTITNINYSQQEVTLDTGNVDILTAFNTGDEIYFYGDRNLNFGNFEVGSYAEMKVMDEDISGLRKITGINIIDGMIFWTDNFSEPKKVNIKRSKKGSDSASWPGIGRRNRKIDDFNQHTLLVINDENPKERYIDVSQCGFGCNDPYALNYDPLTSSGSEEEEEGRENCIYAIQGCTDFGAINYNVDANVDDGSCCYIGGCPDPAACNYNADSCLVFEHEDDDGPSDIDYGAYDCQYEGCAQGCTDPTASNYDPNATIDDGSCEKRTEVIVDGCECIEVFQSDGYSGQTWDDLGKCNDANYSNFNTGCCADEVVYGCTDDTASNYDANATCECGLTTGSPAGNGVTANSCCEYGELGCTDPYATNFDPTATIDDGSCTFRSTGCTDPTADNFDPAADTDDGSCQYTGCMDPLYVQYNSIYTINDQSECLTLVSSSLLALGDTHQGGIIFYLDGFGGGLVIGPVDGATSANVSTGKWGCSGTNIAGLGTDLGDGDANTTLITNSSCSSLQYAAAQCDAITSSTSSWTQSYSDWFLPSEDEMLLATLKLGSGATGTNSAGVSLDNIADFAYAQWYWVSVQSPSSPSSQAMAVSTSAQTTAEIVKTALVRYRPVRSF